MDKTKETPSERRQRALSKLCELRGTSELNELEQKADEAIRTVCGRRGLQTAEDMHRAMRYISNNGYTAEEKPYLHEIVAKRFYRGI